MIVPITDGKPRSPSATLRSSVSAMIAVVCKCSGWSQPRPRPAGQLRIRLVDEQSAAADANLPSAGIKLFDSDPLRTRAAFRSSLLAMPGALVYHSPKANCNCLTIARAAPWPGHRRLASNSLPPVPRPTVSKSLDQSGPPVRRAAWPNRSPPARTIRRACPILRPSERSTRRSVARRTGLSR